MYLITYNNKQYQCRENETVLEVCLRNGLTVPFSCKQGVCHVCLMQSENHSPPERSQKGLKAALIEQNYFKICQCVPDANMQIRLPRSKDTNTSANTVTIAEKPPKAIPKCVKNEQSKQSIEREAPPPDPEMWAAMQNGVLLKQILTTFYTWVFEDDILKPYFDNVTKQRLIEKVYSFLYQIFTGEKVFFGERPRNGHHWMVITEDIFAHREALMEKS
jgi:ferredoxin